ncbi:MAG: plasmid partitioning protein RepB [Chloroflexota bacterium]
MSKRTDTIRSLFAQAPVPVLSADNTPTEPRRVAAGPVRSMQETFSDVERENEALRARLAGTEQVVDIDPDIIDPSPFADRFDLTDDPSFEALKQSIAERGQEIPVLLRAHGAAPGRYQTAFGHRRIRAARLLGRKVKAIVRVLSDDELIVAQGVENAAREDLSFIERAVFALRLETSGRGRIIIQQALAIDRAEASKLIAVARAVPDDLARAIGKAPKIGRGRWQELADALQEKMALKRAKAAAHAPGFAEADGDERFLRVLRAAKQSAPTPTPAVIGISNARGEALGEIRATTHEVKLRLAKPEGTAFAQFLAARLPALVEAFHASGAGDGDSESK